MEKDKGSKKPIKEYIFPQLMKSIVYAYKIYESTETIEIDTNMATIKINNNKVDIDWSIQTIIKVKKYYKK